MNKSIWGPITWILLHSLVNKIRVDKLNKTDIENLKIIINDIISNLPCNDCSMHATIFFKKNIFFKLNTIEDINFFLYKFHNIVNEKTKKSVSMTYQECKLKYSSLQLSKVINHFILVYKNSNSTNRHLILDAFIRKTMLNNFIKYIKQNQSLYNA